jgi:hypothetical protein
VKLRAIIPVKSLSEGKGRLAAVLGAAEREALNAELLDHMLSVTSGFPGAAATIVVSPDRDVLDRAAAAGAETLVDESNDLNAALDGAARHAADQGADGILIVPVDLPLAGPADLLTMASCRRGFVIAPSARTASERISTPPARPGSTPRSPPSPTSPSTSIRPTTTANGAGSPPRHRFPRLKPSNPDLVEHRPGQRAVAVAP